MPPTCSDCGAANPELIDGRCAHRKACEARQMLKRGMSAEAAAAHAQGESIFGTDEEIAEALKDLAYILNAVSIRVTIRTGRDTFRNITVSHASGLSDSPDGWETDVIVTEI